MALRQHFKIEINSQSDWKKIRKV